MILDEDEFKGYLLLRGFVKRSDYIISSDDNVCLWFNDEGFLTDVIYHFPPFDNMHIKYVQPDHFFKCSLTEYDGYNSLGIGFKINPVLFDIKNNEVMFKSFDNKDIFKMKLDINDFPICKQNDKVYVEI